MLVNGFVYPIPSAILGMVYLVGMLIKGVSYSLRGPKARLFGALLAHLGDLPLFFLTFRTAYLVF